MLLSDKVDFRAKKFTKDREKDYIIINGSIHQKDTAILNVYTSNNNAAKYVKQKLIKLRRKIDTSTIIVGNINSPLSIIDKSTRQNISKDEELSNTIIQQDLIDGYRTLHPTTAEFFPSAYRIFTKIDYILDHKTNLNKFKRIENIHNVYQSRNQNTTYQNLWDTAKAVHRRKFIALNVYIREKGESQINSLSSYFKNLKKKNKIRPNSRNQWNWKQKTRHKSMKQKLVF